MLGVPVLAMELWIISNYRLFADEVFVGFAIHHGGKHGRI